MDMRLMTTLLLLGSSVPAQAEQRDAGDEQPVRVEVVPEREMGTITGKFLGNNMLVGVRVDIVSQWRDANGSSLSAQGALKLERGANGQMQLSISTQANALQGGTATPISGTRSATGGASVNVEGITQLNQIAGDGNQMTNVTQIGMVDQLSGGAFNGISSSEAAQGDYRAQVSFGSGGLQLSLVGPNSEMTQSVGGNTQGLAQRNVISGDLQAGANLLDIQVQTAPIADQAMRQWGVHQALAGMQGVGR